jgi:hypothetical protein
MLGQVLHTAWPCKLEELAPPWVVRSIFASAAYHFVMWRVVKEQRWGIGETKRNK